MASKITEAHLTSFQAILNYSFKDKELLKMALLHPSHSLRKKVSPFERLEFLGDRVLGLVIADLLFHMFPMEKEGDLARRLAALVSRTQCLEIGITLEIEKFVVMAGGRTQGQTTILADTLEALIGAIFLDQGLEAAKRFIVHFWQPYLQTSQASSDSKTLLQEWAQGQGYAIPTYTIISVEGPPHAPRFLVEVRAGNQSMTDFGPSRRQAEQKAAKKLLDTLLS